MKANVSFYLRVSALSYGIPVPWRKKCCLFENPQSFLQVTMDEDGEM